MTAIGKAGQEEYLLIRSILYQYINSNVQTLPLEGDQSLWNSVYSFSKKQSLLGIAFSAIAQSSVNSSLPRPFLMRWCAVAETIKRANFKHVEILKEISSEFEAEGIHFYILKGLTVSTCYPDPTLRQPGDIDLFFHTQEDFQKVIAWAKRCGYTLTSSVKHCSMEYKGVHLEFHPMLPVLSYPPVAKRMRLFIENDILENGYTSCFIEGTFKVSTLPFYSNCLYQLLHISEHFHASGIGLRQFCDLAFFFKYHHDKSFRMSKQEFSEVIEDLGMHKIANAIASILIDLFGLSEHMIPFKYYYEPKYHHLLEDIFNGGNFGQYAKRSERPKNVLLRKVYTARLMVERGIKYSYFAPYEALFRPLHYLSANLPFRNQNTI